MKKTPFQQMQERFKSKDKLVEAVQELATEELFIDRVNAEKGLGHASNRKLIRLHEILSDAKKRFGSRKNLISAILELEKRAKDPGYRKRLEQFPLPRLLDQHASVQRRARRAEVKAMPVEAKPKKKAPQKRAAKKPAKKPAKALTQKAAAKKRRAKKGK